MPAEGAIYTDTGKSDILESSLQLESRARDLLMTRLQFFESILGGLGDSAVFSLLLRPPAEDSEERRDFKT